MIRYVSGDILFTHTNAVAHGVAPNDPFNQGLAHVLREHQPAMYRDFRHYCQSHHPREGGLWVWAGIGGVRIVALFTQASAYDHGSKPGPATEANVNHALKALATECRLQGWRSLSLPKLATGVGGLEWSVVKPLIEHHLGDIGIPVIVYEEYIPNHVAQEFLD